MADSNSEPPRCRCGFWGSAKTMGLCSKCFQEHKKQSSETSGISDGRKADLLSQAMDRIKPTTASSHRTDSSANTLESSTDAAASTSADSEAAATATSTRESIAASAQDVKTDSSTSTVADSAGKTSAAAEEDEDSAQGLVDGEPQAKRYKIEEELDLPQQKNKKRCFKCNIKLELAIREIGRCRCEYVFCQLHRLPEQHDCIFDHKQEGRKVARDKMVSPKKHMGNSLKRIDSDS